MIYGLDDVDIKIVKVDVYDKNGNWHGDEWNYEMDRLVDDYGYDCIYTREIWKENIETMWGIFMKVVKREVMKW